MMAAGTVAAGIVVVVNSATVNHNDDVGVLLVPALTDSKNHHVLHGIAERRLLFVGL